MSTVLTITGAVFELCGLGFVFYELVLIRKDESGAPPLPSMPTQPEAINVPLIKTAEHFLGFSDLDRAEAQAAETNQRAALRHAELRARSVEEEVSRVEVEIARLEAERRETLQRALHRQAGGAALVLAGLVLGTIGNVM